MSPFQVFVVTSLGVFLPMLYLWQTTARQLRRVTAQLDAERSTTRIIYTRDTQGVCTCYRCINYNNITYEDTRIGLHYMMFIACNICGNKRCPHAKDHNKACTNSNALGQE
jgi:hypothetical protein